jgi:cation diffusion facilitator family transporter
MALDPSSVAGQQRTAIASIAAAGLLVVLKLGTGLLTGSLGLISAGIESSGDVVAALVTLYAIRLGGRPADAEHPYGHRRAENLSALAEATILLAGGTVVVVEAIGRLAGGGSHLTAHWEVFAVLLVAIAVDLTRVVVSVRTSRHYGSAALRSNAFHFAGDMAGSLAVLAGLVVVRAGVEEGDAIAALVVAGLIFAAAARLVTENASVLMDAAPAQAQAAARAAVDALGPDIGLRRLRLRESSGRFFADVVVTVPAGSAVVEGHAAADQVEDAIERALPAADVVVHVEPRRRGLELRERVLVAALAEPMVKEAHDIAIFEHDSRATVSLHLKLPEDLSLAEAHAVSERVERAIRADARVEAIQTHLEPLERPMAARPGTGRDEPEVLRDIDRLVADALGDPPRSLRLLSTDHGPVLFVSVGLAGQPGLMEAHRLASELEVTLREQHPDLIEVVVHTEPAPRTGPAPGAPGR